MEFLRGTFGRVVMNEVESASAVNIASAFFSPGDEVIDVLEDVPELRIFVSRDFSVSDPYGLERLSENASVECIPVDSREGRFHAKVVVCQRENGSKAAFVGSANFTGPGLFHNHEAGLKLDTADGDGEIIGDMEDWINSLDKLGMVPDWDLAQSIHRKERTHPRSVASAQPENGDGRNYWVLKTRSGDTWVDHWQKFKSEQVVAIGWEDLPLDPSEHSKERIASELDKVYDDEEVGRPSRAAGTILTFVNEWKEGDLVVICRGFPANSSSDVPFYGFARVDGSFFVDQSDSQWKFKRPATHQKVEVRLPKNLFTEAFDRKSLIGTMHDLTEEQFFDFCRRVESKHGVSLKL